MNKKLRRMRFLTPKIDDENPVEISNAWRNQYLNNFREKSTHNPKEFNETVDLHLDYSEKFCYVDPKKNPTETIKFLEPIGYGKGLITNERLILFVLVAALIMLLLILMGLIFA